ncbi:MAG: addB, partial [Alphaproteobacteria bacterium]|nr:addB [Alphaproteobacteria bacterium]
RMIMAREDINLTANEAFRLAGDLARFLDRAHTEQIDLEGLDNLVTGDLAEHWQITKKFLEIVTDAWPVILAERSQSDPAERRNIVFQKKIESLRDNPPQHRIIAAGSTGSIPSTARLLDVIARLPNGSVVLPGIDPNIDDKLWDAIDDMHPYHYQKRLINLMDIDRKSVKLWPGSTDGRLNEILPRKWQKENQREKLKIAHFALQPQGIFDLSDAVIDGSHLHNLDFIIGEQPLHEAKIIALALRDALNTPEQTAMVVTPDRILAQHIQQEMLRWNIEVNDSGGQKLSETPIGLFLKLIAGFPNTSCPATHILSILRHGLFRLHPPEEKRAEDIHALETILRQQFLPAGGLQEFCKTYENPLLHETLSIVEPFIIDGTRPLCEWLEVHIKAAEALATTPNLNGAEILWKFEDGEAASQLFYKLHEASLSNPLAMSSADYAYFISSAMEQIVVRPRFGVHPRLRILSPIEARLQDADIIILAGLNEGVWPAPVAADAWLSRPMQQEMGFASPDRRIGQSALDFMLLFCAPRVIMTWSKKREGVQAHASRWLQQVFAVMNKNNCLPVFDASPYYHWAKIWDEPTKLAPLPAPSFAPPLAQRPRKLSVTAIGTLQNDPYSLYAQRILKLQPSELLDRQPDPRDWGTAAHAILEDFFREDGFLQADPAAYFDHIAARKINPYPLNQAQQKAWYGKIAVIRDWLLANEQGNEARVFTESNLSMKLKLADGTSFQLTGRADRLDVMGDRLTITDYKTGVPPGDNKIKKGLFPQMPLLGLLAQHTAGLQAKEINLRYIKLNGKIARPADIRP